MEGRLINRLIKSLACLFLHALCFHSLLLLLLQSPLLLPPLPLPILPLHLVFTVLLLPSSLAYELIKELTYSHVCVCGSEILREDSRVLWGDTAFDSASGPDHKHNLS